MTFETTITNLFTNWNWQTYLVSTTLAYTTTTLFAILLREWMFDIRIFIFIITPPLILTIAYLLGRLVL